MRELAWKEWLALEGDPARIPHATSVGQNCLQLVPADGRTVFRANLPGLGSHMIAQGLSRVIGSKLAGHD
jgi:hypothetical protein